MLNIYGARAQPFGLLSNNAQVPFKVNNKEWKTVTEYVYVSMFGGPSQIEMAENLTPEPYVAMIKIKDKQDKAIYDRSLLEGLAARFDGNPALQKRLEETRGKNLVYSNKDIQNFLDYRRSPKDVISNPLIGDVPYSEAEKVITGVELEIMRNPLLPINALYSDLKQYAISKPPARPKTDPAYYHLDKLVPYLRSQLGQKLYDTQVEQFKVMLLDVYLDYILETEYPDVKPGDYRRAKDQQILKEPDIQIYENQLFNLYEKGQMDHLILKRLTFTPDKSLITTKSPSQTLDDYVIQEDDSFLPTFMEDTIIGNKIYRSAVHFAYHQLLVSMGLNIDVNAFPTIQALTEQYEIIENNWITDRLTSNNERATFEKFKIPTMAQILLMTGTMPIAWDDPTDPVLGVGPDRKGGNRSGVYLTHLRGKVQPSTHSMKDYGLMSGNLFIRDWMSMRAADYKNTFNLLKDPTLGQFETIYGCPGLTSSPKIPPTDRKVLTNKGLNSSQTRIVWPLLVSQYRIIQNLSEREALGILIDAQSKLNAKPTGNARQRAASNLRQIFKKLTPLGTISEADFLRAVLSPRGSNLDSAPYNRINYWSKF